MRNNCSSKKPLQKSSGFTIMEFMLALAGGILVLLAAFFAWEKFGSPLVFKYSASNELNTILSQASSIKASWGGSYPQTQITNIGQDCQQYISGSSSSGSSGSGSSSQIGPETVVCDALTNGNQSTLNNLIYWGYACQGGNLDITGYFGNVPGGVGSSEANSILTDIAASVQSDSGWDCTGTNSGDGSGVNTQYGTISCVKTGVVCSPSLQ